MSKEAKMKAPTQEEEMLLESVLEGTPTIVELRGKKVKVGWLKRGTIRKVTSIMNAEGNDDKASCQCAAAILLNGYWSIKLYWWLLWRWYYYIKQYGDHELMPIILEGKKKIPAREYLISTILLTEMKDTMMQMTKKEASSILREPTTDKAGK